VLKLAAVGAAGWASLPIMAGPFDESDFASLIPADKKLDPAWVASLYARGEPQVYSAQRGELRHIGMPIGGIACGQLYLGGDGRLWHWEIFDSRTHSGYGDSRYRPTVLGGHYANPMAVESPVEQGFALRVAAGGDETTRRLDARDFADIRFRGEYPVGRVQYRDRQLPVDVDLEAFSPFCPLNVEDSSLPATRMRFTVRNRSEQAVSIQIAGWLENAVCPEIDDPSAGDRVFRVAHRTGRVSLLHKVASPESTRSELRPDITFADFEGGDWAGWTVEGEAFGSRPFRVDELAPHDPISGVRGKGLVNSHNTRKAGPNSPASDKLVGRLLSPEFTISRDYISFLIAGGSHRERTEVRLLVDGKQVAARVGDDTIRLKATFFDVRKLAGRKARLEAVDQHTGGWGHIVFDHIVFTDEAPSPLERSSGYGSMALSLLDSDYSPLAIHVDDPVDAKALFDRLATGRRDDTKRRPFGQRLIGALAAPRVTLEPGEERSFTFLVTWFFPLYTQGRGEMGAITGWGGLKRHYANRFDSADAVAAYVTKHRERLESQTLEWNRTWYDSTLPYWMLDRTFVALDCLATQTLHWFDNGRFWGWEGTNCCPGTCQHVWNYAQGLARIFPSIERYLREEVDFGLAWKKTGELGYRAETAMHVAHDGQAGTIIRAYREHQMSADGAFLRRRWPRIKKAVEYLIREDGDDNGLLEGRQYNTLDAAWYGPMGWLSSLYLGAVNAGRAMAREMGDDGFAVRCERILEAGRRNIVRELFNGEYFIHRPDPAHPEAINTNDGSEIDQIMGQSLMGQVGLSHVIPRRETVSALRSLWKYNFAPDAGAYRNGMQQQIPGGRWYAMEGEAGLVMCTFPRGGADKAVGRRKGDLFAAYLNECMNGFEYLAAAGMVAEGLVEEGLACFRAVHDRYHATRRNPYNEIECSDHYSRSMASYGIYIALCGYEYHGPQRHLGFAPRLSPERFRAAFTAAEGWGTFDQEIDASRLQATIRLRYGTLALDTIALSLAGAVTGKTVRRATIDGRAVGKVEQDGDRVVVHADETAMVQAGRRLVVTLEI